MERNGGHSWQAVAGKAGASGSLPHNFVTLNEIGLRGFVKGALARVTTLAR